MPRTQLEAMLHSCCNIHSQILSRPAPPVHTSDTSAVHSLLTTTTVLTAASIMATSISKFSGSAKVLKELQGLASFVSYEACFQQGTSMTTVSMENSMEAQYFGDPTDSDSIGLADQLVKGVGIFAGLYSEELLQSSVTTSDPSRLYNHGGGGGEELLRSTAPATLSSSGLVLVMKPELHCLGEDKKIVVGGTNGLKLSTMLASGLTQKAFEVNIKGRTLLSRSREILKNCKKALAIVSRHDSPYKAYMSSGLLPSGMCLDDYLLYIRQKMYVALLPPSIGNNKPDHCMMVSDTTPVASVASVAESSSDFGRNESLGYSDEGNDVLMNTMPDSYVFPGYLVFALLGPIVPPEMRPHQSHLIMTKPPVEDDTSEQSKRKSETDTAGSRKMHKVKVEKGVGRVKEEPGRNSSTSPTKTKGYTINQQLQIAAMAQSKMVIDNRVRTDLSDCIIAMQTNKVAGKKALIEELKFLITNTSSDDPDRSVYMKELKMLHHELGSALDELLLSEQSIIAAATLQIEAESTKTKNKSEGVTEVLNTDVIVDLTILSPAASGVTMENYDIHSFAGAADEASMAKND